MPLFNAALSLFLLAGLIFLVWKKWAKGTCWNPIFWPALLFKLACGIFLGIFYNGINDTFKYQDASEMLTQLGRENFGNYLQLMFLGNYQFLPPEFLEFHIKTYSNSFFFVQLLSGLNFLTGSQYYLNSLFLSFFSFTGCWYFVRTLDRVFPGTANAAIVSFLFFPSVVFWNSGVLKEGLLLGFLGFFWASALQLVYRPEGGLTKKLLLLLVSAYGLWKIKFFVAAFVYGLTGLWLGLKWLQTRFPVFRKPLYLGLALTGLACFLALGISFLHENFNLQFFLDRLVWNYEKLYHLSEGRPRIALNSFEPDLYSVFRNIPEALVGVMYRPFIWEGNSWLYRLAGLENLILLIITLGVLAGLPRIFKQKPKGFYLLLLVFGLVLAVTFALATPNLGSLNRYRVTFLPFLLYLALQAPLWQRLLNRLG